MSFVFTQFGAAGNAYASALIGGMFGANHSGLFPSTYTLNLGTTTLLPYTATVSVPNDGANWVALAGGGGMTNAQRIAFTPLTSGDVSGWDATGMSVIVTDPLSTPVAYAVYESSDPLLTPQVGLVITIPAQRLIWGVNNI